MAIAVLLISGIPRYKKAGKNLRVSFSAIYCTFTAPNSALLVVFYPAPPLFRPVIGLTLGTPLDSCIETGNVMVCNSSGIGVLLFPLALALGQYQMISKHRTRYCGEVHNSTQTYYSKQF